VLEELSRIPPIECTELAVELRRDRGRPCVVRLRCQGQLINGPRQDGVATHLCKGNSCRSCRPLGDRAAKLSKDFPAPGEENMVGASDRLRAGAPRSSLGGKRRGQLTGRRDRCRDYRSIIAGRLCREERAQRAGISSKGPRVMNKCASYLMPLHCKAHPCLQQSSFDDDGPRRRQPQPTILRDRHVMGTAASLPHRAPPPAH